MAFLKSKWFLAIVGLLLLGLVIWFAGPYFAFADYRPLESVIARVVAILVVLLVYVGIVMLKQLKSNKASKAIANDVSAQDGGSRGGGADAQQLKKRFDEAIEALRKSKKKGARNLYELPWYIIIGPPGSGKTTVLVNSGLNFPLAQKFGKEALRGVGGTRNCDWWFTDEAILLDTAGRYTTQDSNAEADAGGWKAFLQLLRKHRRRQPINGVVVAISASDLLTLSDRDRERHVGAIRERLDELNRELKIEAPVYVLVTKCDLIAGFTEFFDDLGQDGRSQVWGVTFPIQDSETGHAAPNFAREFDRLLERLQSRVLDRVEQERDPRRRTAALAFPQQVASLKPMLADLLQRVFSGSDFDSSSVLLRGVYLTSGTQEGTPIDRMMGAIARNFGFTSAVAPSASGQGKAYFIERLLKNVLFRESGIAGVNRRLQLQKALLHSGAYLACVAVLVLGIIALLVSYRSNGAYIEEVATTTRDLAGTEPPAGPSGISVDFLLPRLDALNAVVQTAESHKGDVPLGMRMGLYRGNSLGEAARTAYGRELNASLLPLLGRQFEQRLVMNAGELDRLYEYLKGYLMFGDEDHRDVDHLRFLAQVEWQQMLPADGDAASRLEQHFEQLLADPDRLKSMPIDENVVAQSRAAFRNASLAVLMFSRLKLNYVDDDRGIRLDVASGPGADIVLARKSGAKLADPVPALYTRKVFNEVNASGKYEVIKQFVEDSWVFGEGVIDMRQAPAYSPQVMRVYEDNYIQYWDLLVKDVGLVSTQDTAKLSEVLGIVSSPTSPLKGFLQQVADQTDLLKPDEDLANKAANAASEVAEAKRKQLEKMFGNAATAPRDKPGARASAAFEPIRKLVSGPPGGAQIDRLLGVLGQMSRQLQAIGTGIGQTGGLEAMTQPGQVEAMQNLQVEAKQLPAPIGDMILQLGQKGQSVATGQARSELAALYNTFVRRECTELIEGRYPFAASEREVPLDDFGRVFGYNGVFDSFFRDNLAKLVDTSRTPWRWREGAAEIGGSAAMLNQFQQVQRIREVYFRPGQQVPGIRFNMTPDALDAEVGRFALELDGQLLEYRHGPQQTRAVTWPGGAGGQSSVVFEERSGMGGPSMAFQGPWAWFRVLDRAQVQRLSDTRFLASFTVQNRSARVLLEATSIRNPFTLGELQRFRCGV